MGVSTSDKPGFITAESQSPGVGPGGPIQVISDPSRNSTLCAEILQQAEGPRREHHFDGGSPAGEAHGRRVVILATGAVTDPRSRS